jgi:Ser/Thr protein kinase RdoA (MazF antagonist)
MNKELVERILRAYGLQYSEIHDPQKGYRNRSYAVTLKDRTVNLMLYKTEPAMLARIKRANAVSDYLYDQGFPARSTTDHRIIRLSAGSYEKFGALYRYLPGHTIPWEAYTQDHIKLLGKTMSDMHAALADAEIPGLPEAADEYLAIVGRMRAYFSDGPVQRALADKLLLQIQPEIFDEFEHILTGSKLLPTKQPLHMDFVRSNILFDDTPADAALKVTITGILDFEKTAYGHPIFDVARTLAFLLVDCKYKEPEKVRKYFLGSGYIKRGAAVLPVRHMDLLEPLLGVFLFYDLYKFLRHNPYESLPFNEHFMRTVALLIPRKLVVPTTSIVRS